MDVRNTDVKKRRKGAIISAVVMIGIMLIWDVFMITLCLNDSEVFPLMLMFVAGPTVVIIGVIIALFQRLKEIKGGEIDEAGNY